jgi:hypothetical protein
VVIRLARWLRSIFRPRGFSKTLEAFTEPMTKETKKDAGYREGRKDYKCALCTMFRPPHQCTTVKGWISPLDVCNYFEPK